MSFGAIGHRRTSLGYTFQAEPPGPHQPGPTYHENGSYGAPLDGCGCMLQPNPCGAAKRHGLAGCPASMPGGLAGVEALGAYNPINKCAKAKATYARKKPEIEAEIRELRAEGRRGPLGFRWGDGSKKIERLRKRLDKLRQASEAACAAAREVGGDPQAAFDQAYQQASMQTSASEQALTTALAQTGSGTSWLIPIIMLVVVGGFGAFFFLKPTPKPRKAAA